jgi:stage II sporulation SpoE-like protein
VPRGPARIPGTAVAVLASLSLMAGTVLALDAGDAAAKKDLPGTLSKPELVAKKHVPGSKKRALGKAERKQSPPTANELKDPKEDKHGGVPDTPPPMQVPDPPDVGSVVPTNAAPAISRPAQPSPPRSSQPAQKDQTGRSAIGGAPSRRGSAGRTRGRSAALGRTGSARSGRTRARSARRAASRHRSSKRLPARRSQDSPAHDSGGQGVTGTVKDIVQVVPDSVKLALAALAALSVMLGVGSLLAALRARRLDRQRNDLLQDMGLLQRALLPPVPQTLGAVCASVAYRPADGPGAGGDFYDALTLRGGRAAFLLGDVSGHGRTALERTAFLRYTLRAYLEAGLEPRTALQVAGRVTGDKLGGDFATVVLAVHEPATGSLIYASAGHPPPVVVGADEHEPLLVGSSPPIGVGARTGLRQTSVPLPPGSLACLHTDGLTEARTADGLFGRERLTELLRELGTGVTASDLLERVAADAKSVPDDMAACVVAPTMGVTAGDFQIEQLELAVEDLDGPLAERFLDACRVGDAERRRALPEARATVSRYGGAILQVVFGNRRTVEVLPRNVESIEMASRRAAAS